jgi:hypothetical protein
MTMTTTEQQTYWKTLDREVPRPLSSKEIEESDHALAKAVKLEAAQKEDARKDATAHRKKITETRKLMAKLAEETETGKRMVVMRVDEVREGDRRVAYYPSGSPYTAENLLDERPLTAEELANPPLIPADALKAAGAAGGGGKHGAARAQAVLDMGDEEDEGDPPADAPSGPAARGKPALTSVQGGKAGKPKGKTTPKKGAKPKR